MILIFVQMVPGAASIKLFIPKAVTSELKFKKKLTKINFSPKKI
jgi:hypothetical protein